MFKTIFRSLLILTLPLFVGLNLMFGLGMTSTVPVSAQLSRDIQILNYKCLIPNPTSTNPALRCTYDESVFGNIIKYLTPLAAAVAVLTIVWGGYKYFLSGLGGDERTDGRETIRYGVIGLFVVMLANSIVTAITETFNSSGQIVQITDVFNANTGIPKLINLVLNNFFFPLASLFALLVIVYGGYQYFFSNMPNSKADGRQTIMKGLTGLIFVLIARPLITAIKDVIDFQNSTGTTTIKVDGIVKLIRDFLNNLLIPLSSVVAVAFFVLAGYYLITANGNSEQQKKAWEALRNAAIGLVVVLLSTVAVQMIIFASSVVV